MQLHPSILKRTSLQAIYSRPALSLILTPTLKAAECKPHVREKERNVVHHLPTPLGTAKAQAINYLTITLKWTQFLKVFM